jgi:hypothetical protein
MDVVDRILGKFENLSSEQERETRVFFTGLELSIRPCLRRAERGALLFRGKVARELKKKRIRSQPKSPGKN